MTLGRMLQMAALRPGERVLDVGGGSGYGAALMDDMGAKVIVLESDLGAAATARAELSGRPNVRVVEGPLSDAPASLGPFDLIIMEGAFEITPEALLARLADSGRLIGIDASTKAPQAVIYEKVDGALSWRSLFDAYGETLDGFQPGVSFAF
jgi:protein-L-isoaspartate(D-aspartate) O-methyltransferase